jgi:hypothetical protein
MAAVNCPSVSSDGTIRNSRGVRGACKFKKSDLARIIDVARAKGVDRVWVERDGTIVLAIANSDEAPAEPKTKDVFDTWADVS